MLKGLLNERSINGKLTILIMATLAAAFLLSGAALIGAEWLLARKTAIRDLSTLAGVVGRNSTAALVFNDRKSAKETLAALSFEPQIVFGCIYDAGGNLFVSYHGNGDASCPLKLAEVEADFEVSRLSYVNPIFLDRDRVGEIYLRSNLDHLTSTIKVYAGLLALVMMISGMLAYHFSAKLRGPISEPILALARTAERVSHKKDYSIRAMESEQKEINVLVRAFNEMLQLVNEREMSLRKQADRFSFLADLSKAMAGTLDPDEVVVRVASLAVPFLSDLCVVDLLQQGDRGDARPCGAAVLRPATSGEARLDRLRRAHPFRWSPALPLERILRTGKAELLRQTRDPELGIHSCIAVPLRVRDQVFGTVAFGLISDDRSYESEDLAFAEEVGGRAALAIDNARLYREAQKAIRLRDEFLLVASHELKTPATSIVLTIQNLARMLERGAIATAQDKQVDKLLRIASRQMDRFLGLIDDLLEVSRISEGRLTLHREKFDLSEMLHEVVERVEPQLSLPRSPVRILASRPVQGYWDRIRIESVLVNLLTNALKYGAGRPIELMVEQEGNKARVKVSDQGIGIAKEDYDRIFGRFERGVSLGHFGGLGIGLYIVHEVLKAHGGTIRVESEQGKGAVFTVELPLHPAGPPGG